MQWHSDLQPKQGALPVCWTQRWVKVGPREMLRAFLPAVKISVMQTWHHHHHTLGSPVSLGMVLVSLWALAPATLPLADWGGGSTHPSLSGDPTGLASSSMSLLVKILPCSGNKKKRMFVFLFFPKLPELAALWPRVAGNMGFGLWGPCQVLTIDQVCGWENNCSSN